MLSKRIRLAALMIAAALAVPTTAIAQQFDTSKPIRLIVALSPGGGTDVTARLVAQKMSVSMGVNVIVENKTGGNFIPAGREVLTAAPDGHTLYFISTSSVITQTMHSDYPFDITKFSPVTEAATGPLILVVRNDLGVKTFAELLDRMKKEPDKIKFGLGGGVGSSLGMATELLKARTGVKIASVPYRGAADSLNNLLGGHIDAMFDAMPVMAVQAKEGKVTPIAVTGDKRSFLLPNVPTLKEQGLDFLINGWYGVLAPPDTPASIVKRLRDEIAKAVKDPAAVDALAKQGMEPRGTEPAAWAKYMDEEKAFYAKVVKDAGIAK